MEVSIYLSMTVFAYLLFYMSHSHTINIWYATLLKILSLFVFIGLGVMSLQLTYPMTNAINYSPKTFNSENWQIALCVMYSLTGFLNFSFAVIDILDYNKIRKEAIE